MNYPSFILKNDWFIETEIMKQKSRTMIFKKDYEFLANNEGIYNIEWLGGKLEFNLNEIRNFNSIEDIFIEKIDRFDIVIEEIPDNDDNLISNWRIQLDVKTTKKKLKEIQSLIEKYIKPIL